LGLGFVLVRQSSSVSVLFSLALLFGWILIERWRRRHRASERLLWLPGGLILASAVATLIDSAEGNQGTRWLDPLGLPALTVPEVALVLAGLGAIYALGALLGGASSN
jgi:hypothetical protein